MKKRDSISKILEVCAVISFTALIFVVFLQVFARFFLPKTPSWTEEVSRFLFIYSVAFGAPLALKRNEYVRVDILVDKIPESIRKKLDGVIYLVIALFFLLVGMYGVIYARLGTIQTSPAMGLPMVIPYASISLSSIFLLFYAFKKFLGIVKKEVKSDTSQNERGV